MNQSGLHCIISGRVQGVFYRASTQKQAKILGVSGWVRNLPDGNVETMAFGTTEKLEQFKDWLWQGPSRAKVENVEVKQIPWEEYKTFEVK